jgi:hypothetical protein
MPEAHEYHTSGTTTFQAAIGYDVLDASWEPDEPGYSATALYAYVRDAVRHKLDRHRASGWKVCNRP